MGKLDENKNEEIVPDPEMLKNLDMLMNYEVIEDEGDWDLISEMNEIEDEGSSNKEDFFTEVEDEK